MPHPKNHLKLTGDTHLPDVEVDMFVAEDDEPLEAAPADASASRIYADGYVPASEAATASPQPEPQPEPEGKLALVERKVEEFPARSPWLAIGSGIALGWMAARMLRMLRR